jgi:glucose/arabinose dehydrogenase
VYLFSPLLSFLDFKQHSAYAIEESTMKPGRPNMKVALGLAAQIIQGALAATAGCTSRLSSSYPAPIVADGWSFQLVATGLTSPRGILFDSNGGLLVVQQGLGVIHLSLSDNGSTCVEVSKTTNLINSSAARSERSPTLLNVVANGLQLNHGIALSNDGKTLYASSSESVFSWAYNADKMGVSVSGTNQTVITNMSSSDHATRTLLMSQKVPGMIIVSRGSSSNIDPDAQSLSSGHSQIKAFNTSNLISTSPPYDFNSEGRLLGWGLRNSVGVAEEPLTGGIYSVENSADQVERNGVDIHENNPGEEMNFHGFLNASTEHQGGNYGYPNCFAVWNTSIPDPENLTVGSQFAMDQNSSLNDTICAIQYIPPRLTFQAHMAPLDIKFLSNGTEAYITFHGSWYVLCSYFFPFQVPFPLILQSKVKPPIGTVPTQWATKSPLPASLLVPRSHPQIAQPRLLTSSLTRTYQVARTIASVL